MDWKQKLTKIVKGDKVRVIKRCECKYWHSSNCVNTFGKEILTVRYETEDGFSCETKTGGSNCNFTIDQLEKVF